MSERHGKAQWAYSNQGAMKIEEHKSFICLTLLVFFAMSCSNHNSEMSFAPPGSREIGGSGIRSRETRKTFLGDTELSKTVSDSLLTQILTEWGFSKGPLILFLLSLFNCLFNCSIQGIHNVPPGLKLMPMRNQFFWKFLLFFLLATAIYLSRQDLNFPLLFAARSSG